MVFDFVLFLQLEFDEPQSRIQDNNESWSYAIGFGKLTSPMGHYKSVAIWIYGQYSQVWKSIYSTQTEILVWFCYWHLQVYFNYRNFSLRRIFSRGGVKYWLEMTAVSAATGPVSNQCFMEPIINSCRFMKTHVALGEVVQCPWGKSNFYTQAVASCKLLVILY